MMCDKLYTTTGYMQDIEVKFNSLPFKTFLKPFAYILTTSSSNQLQHLYIRAIIGTK